MLSKIPNLRYFEIVDWRGMNRPAFIAIFHYIDNFGFFQGDSVKFQEGNFLINWTDFVDNIRALRCKVHEQNLVLSHQMVFFECLLSKSRRPFQFILTFCIRTEKVEQK